jgi:hypothetical protein
MQHDVASLPLELSTLSVAPDPAAAAATAAGQQQSVEGPLQGVTLATCPIEILAQIHSYILQADPSLRSCLALESTCRDLFSTLYSNTHFRTVRVNAKQLATTPGSFWSWIAAHGCRTGLLVLKHLELHNATPRLSSRPGVLEAAAVAVYAAMIDTLEPLRGLDNLVSVQYSSPLGHADCDGDASLEPLAGLPALEYVDLGSAVAATTTLTPLCSLAKLTSLMIDNYVAPTLDELAGLSKLRQVVLGGFADVRSMAPLSCLTALTNMNLLGFPLLENLAPLSALSILQHMDLGVLTSQSISLQPLCQLTLLTSLTLAGIYRRGRPELQTTVFDLQPLSALSRTLQDLRLMHAALRNLSSIRSLGATLRRLSLTCCSQQQPGCPVPSLFPSLSHLTFLSATDAAAADVAAVGKHLKCLQELEFSRAHNIISLAALTALTLSSISLQSCSHLRSINPLTELTRLQSLHLLSCPRVASLRLLNRLPNLQKLRLEGCPQLVASVPSSLKGVLVVGG